MEKKMSDNDHADIQFFVNIITGLDSAGPTLPDGALSVSAASNIVYMLAYCGIIPNALCVCECEEAHVYDSENDEPPCKSAQGDGEENERQ
jgi:hypothetical protein